jgi:hypothetical protein
MIDLPDHYPIANAAWEEKMAWLDAETPPFERIREAAPWLNGDDSVRAYLDGMREALSMPSEQIDAIRHLFGAELGKIKLPIEQEIR